jgi:hypothetical protein
MLLNLLLDIAVHIQPVTIYLMGQMHCRTTSVAKPRHFSALTGMVNRSFAGLVGDDS